MNHLEETEWSDFWVTHANAPTLPRLLLVGDSITRSYYAGVCERVASRVHVDRYATSKCVCHGAFTRELSLLLEEHRFAIVHFLNGLHGPAYSEAEYAQGLARVTEWLRERLPAARFILATSTPVRVIGDLNRLSAQTERVRARNRSVKELAAANGWPVDDLFEAVVDHPEYWAADAVHFNADGQQVLAERVAACVAAEIDAVAGA